jgi:hypothetical protein
MLLGALPTKDDMDGLDEFSSSFSDAIEQLLQQVDWPGGERPDLSPKSSLGLAAVNYHQERACFLIALLPHTDRVSIAFQQGRQLASPLLEGETRRVRWVALRPGGPVPWDEVGVLIFEAIALCA